MNIYEVNKIMSSENKSKIISHFWNCKCHCKHVGFLETRMNINQSNLSKHISGLLKLDILKFKQSGKERFYEINQDWKKEWFNIVDPMINSKENSSFQCDCEEEHHEKS